MTTHVFICRNKTIFSHIEYVDTIEIILIYLKGQYFIRIIMRRNVQMIIAIIAVIALVLGLILLKDIFVSSLSPSSDGEREKMTVHFIDTGLGDSILIQTPDSKNILIDAGGSYPASALTSYLTSHSVSIIDALIITHPHDDHLCYADDVLAQFEVKSIYHSGMEASTPDFDNFTSAAVSEGCPIHTDDDIRVGMLLSLSSNVTFHVLAIDQFASNPDDASIVIEMSYGQTNFLFMGDASTVVEHKIVPLFDLEAEVLKVGDHGGDNSTSSEFLAEVTPGYAIVCVGAGNTQGHAFRAAEDRLSAFRADILKTDMDGTIVIESDGQHVTLL